MSTYQTVSIAIALLGSLFLIYPILRDLGTNLERRKLLKTVPLCESERYIIDARLEATARFIEYRKISDTACQCVGTVLLLLSMLVEFELVSLV